VIIGLKLTEQQRSSKRASLSSARTTSASPRSRVPTYCLQRAIGNAATTRLLKSSRIQPKLTVSHPEDESEREADRVADQVMRMPDPVSGSALQRSPLRIQRMCTECEDELQRKTDLGHAPVPEEEEGFVQAKLESSPNRVDSTINRKCESCENELPHETDRQGREQTHQVSAAVSANIGALDSAGSPLPEVTRSFFEPRFGADFSHVRVHTDAKAAASAQTLKAHAYTVGHHIAFAAGQFSPETRTGRQLIAHELTHTFQQTGATGNQPTTERQLQRWGGEFGVPEQEEKSDGNAGTSASVGPTRIAFVREEGLNLREQPDQKSKSLARLPFGQRVYVLTEPNPQPSWLKIAVMSGTGYVFAPKIHFPPEQLITKDPGLALIKVKPGQTFWGLVKEVYGIQGNEGAKDQNINHFINAIKAVNKPEAFKVQEDTLDKIGNFLVSGREATDTYLKAGVDLWIPSFGVAARMDVGSGTIRGEVTRFIRKVDQKITDFKTACKYSIAYIPGAIKKHVGDMASALVDGLIDFAKDAAMILGISTAVGALIGALFGGVGAIPGAEIGFEIGLIILEYYGLYIIIEAIVQLAVGLFSTLADFIKLVWVANGDQKQLKEAGKTLADALGILVSSVLVVLVAYLLKKGGDFIKGTKFGEAVGETRLAKWLEERQKAKTTKTVLNDLKKESGAKGLIGKEFEDFLVKTLGGTGSFKMDGREFDGRIGNRWYEAKSGRYWQDHAQMGPDFDKFKSDMGHRLSIAKTHGATLELHSNTPIPEHAKAWLTKKGIPFTEH